MHQISTNKNQTRGINLKDLMWDVIRLELGCKNKNAKHMGETYHKITWEHSCFRHNLFQKVHSIPLSPSLPFNDKTLQLLSVFFLISMKP